jgi:serine/threonine-protein kinase
MVLLPVLGLLAGAGIAVALLLALSNHDPRSPAVAAEQHQAGTVVLDAQDYVGRPVDEVVARLTGLGLQVRLMSEVRDDVAPDQVTAVEPEGKPLSAGATVVVTYAVATAEDGAQRDGTVVTGVAVGAGASSATGAPGVPDGAAAATSAAGGAADTTTVQATQTESQPSETGTSSETTPSATTTESSSAPASTSSPAAVQ